MIIASRYHDFSAGHRVAGHESKCAYFHGHNYRVHFHCAAGELDKVGRVIDFSQIKSRLCEWVEQEWDHKFLLWIEDPALTFLDTLEDDGTSRDVTTFAESFVIVPFNPTAENMANYLLRQIAPTQLIGTGVRCIAVDIEETRKCSVSTTLGNCFAQEDLQ